MSEVQDGSAASVTSAQPGKPKPSAGMRPEGRAFLDGLKRLGAPLALLAVGCGLGEFPFLTLIALLILPVAVIVFFVQAMRSLPRSTGAERGVIGTPVMLIGGLVLLFGTLVLLLGAVRVPSLVLAPYYRVPPPSGFLVHIGAIAIPVPFLWLATPLILAYGAKLRSRAPFSDALWRFAVVLAVFPLIGLITFLIAQGYPVDA